MLVSRTPQHPRNPCRNAHGASRAWVRSTLAALALAALVQPDASALTGGPAQPELQGFAPIGTSELVNLFTGDLQYAIPIMDVGGYPLTLSYSENITNDDEASVVGLGWTLNPGAINRSIRGLPDDARGDEVVETRSALPNRTWGIGGAIDLELFGTEMGSKLDKFKEWIKKTLGGEVDKSTSISVGLAHNNYYGFSVEAGLEPSISASDKSKGMLTAGLGLNVGSNTSVGIKPSLSYAHHLYRAGRLDSAAGISIGAPFNSREGLKSLSFGLTTVVGYFDKLMKSGGAALGYRAGDSIDFTWPARSARIDFPLDNVNFAYQLKPGIEVNGSTPDITVSGYYSEQRLAISERKQKGYGYLYLQDAGGRDRMDFAREKDGPFTKDTPNLPFTQLSYDLFVATAQGAGGTYRAHRRELGAVHDPVVTDRATDADVSLSIAVELSAGTLAKGGVDITQNATTGRSGPWTSADNISGLLEFGAEDPADPLHEPAWFALEGEATAEREPLFVSNQLAGSLAVRPALTASTSDVPVNPTWATGTTSVEYPVAAVWGDNQRGERPWRPQPMSWLTAREASVVGLDPQIRSYTLNDFTYGTTYTAYTTSTRVSHSGDHLSEITITTQDGTRYVFGIPVYNNREVEVSFSVDPPDEYPCDDGLVDYEATDATTSNTRGRDNWFDREEKPAYAGAYLLTAVLSPNYRDQTGNGPSPDDAGGWTRFNYTRYQDGYRWRVPFEEGKANYNQGLRVDPGDDRGSYVYGEREVWYLHSIESPTQVAEFTYADRLDSYGVRGEAGGLDATMKLQRLEKVTLYARDEKRLKTSKAEPIQTVTFTYDYALTPGVPNNVLNIKTKWGNKKTAGKLTLRSVYTELGSSKKGRLNPTTFRYGDTDHDGTEDQNPRYNLKAYDAWARYAAPSEGACDDLDAEPQRWEAPWTPRGSEVDKYAASWALTDIGLPSGGSIEVDYESDDYAFVQNRRAMQMVQVVGTGNDPDDDEPDEYSDFAPEKLSEPTRYLYFELPLRVPEVKGDAALLKLNAELTKLLLGSDPDVFFKFMLYLHGVGDPDQAESIPGYATVSDEDPDGPYDTFAGVMKNEIKNGYYTHGWIRLTTVAVGDKEVEPDEGHLNPIAKAGMNFIKLNVPQLALGLQGVIGPNDKGDGVVEAMAEFADQIFDFFYGYNRALRLKGYAMSFAPSRSWIRLYVPGADPAYSEDGTITAKKGGGARVAEVRIDDAADDLKMALASRQTAMTYTYTQDEVDAAGNLRTISSGVASYEPLLGGEQNPWRRAIAFEDEHKLAPDDAYMLDAPVGESAFPGPQVGYARVTVQSSTPQVTRHGTGHVEHGFYTSRDFPTRVSETGLRMEHVKPKPVMRILKLSSKDYVTVTQGYAVENNNAHGLPKSERVYGEGDQDPISGVDYQYRTATESLTFNPLHTSAGVTLERTALDDRAEVLLPCQGGTTFARTLGTSIDMVVDMREAKTDTKGGATQLNLDGFMASILPAAVPTLFPSFSEEHVRFRSAVASKVIQRHAVLDAVVAMDLGSSVSTQSRVWDGLTGRVLATETPNAFNDPLYSLTGLAWQAYPGMGLASENLRAGVENLAVVLGKGSFPSTVNLSPDEVFVPGDELYVLDWATADPIAWVLEVDADSVTLIDRAGAPLPTGTYGVRVIRSGHRNQPGAPIWALTTRSKPFSEQDGRVTAVDFAGLDSNTGILDASAAEYRDDWAIFCGKSGGDVSYDCTCDSDTVEDLSGLLQGLSIGVGAGQVLVNRGPGDDPQVVKDILLAYDGNGMHYQVTQGQDLLAQYLADYQPNFGDISWSASGAGSTLEGELSGRDLSSPCPITLELPPSCPYTWEQLADWQDPDTNLLLQWGPIVPDIDPILCSATNAFTTTVTADPAGVGGETWTVTGTSCFSPTCVGAGVDDGWCCGHVPGSTYNPYQQGARGQWAAWRSYSFVVDRDGSAEDIRTEGAYTAFTSFWQLQQDYNWRSLRVLYGADANEDIKDHLTTDRDGAWRWSSQVTRVHPDGQELENQDALGRYSAAQFNLEGTLVEAVASNARLSQIAAEGFESYVGMWVKPGATSCKSRQLDFYAEMTHLDVDVRHTGLASLKLGAGETVEVESPITDTPCEPTDPLQGASSTLMSACDCIGGFAPLSDPTTDLSYVLGYWVKQDSDSALSDYPDPGLRVLLRDKNGIATEAPITSTTRSLPIEGWQRREVEFVIPKGQVGTIEFVLDNAKGTQAAWYDDLRIHPYDSLMKSFVYNPYTHEVVATLDERNYARLFEYDNERQLVRVKQETERGVMTVQEGRTHLTKPVAGDDDAIQD